MRRMLAKEMKPGMVGVILADKFLMKKGEIVIATKGMSGIEPSILSLSSMDWRIKEYVDVEVDVFDKGTLLFAETFVLQGLIYVRGYVFSMTNLFAPDYEGVSDACKKTILIRSLA